MNGTAIATTAPDDKSKRDGQVTLAEAVDLAKRVAGKRLTADTRKANTEREAAEKAVGGQVTSFDASVIAQGRQWMQRLAFIARHLDAERGNNYSYGGTSKSGDALRKIVPRIAGIVGELEALQLTDPTIGLFADVNERDYKIEDYRIREESFEAGDAADSILDALPQLPETLRDEIAAALAGKTLVEKQAKPVEPKAIGGGKRRTRSRAATAEAGAPSDEAVSEPAPPIAAEPGEEAHDDAEDGSEA